MPGDHLRVAKLTAPPIEVGEHGQHAECELRLELRRPQVGTDALVGVGHGRLGEHKARHLRQAAGREVDEMEPRVANAAVETGAEVHAAHALRRPQRAAQGGTSQMWWPYKICDASTARSGVGRGRLQIALLFWVQMRGREVGCCTSV